MFKLLRGLSYLIDFLLIYIPLLFVLSKVTYLGNHYELFAQIMFVIYNIIMLTSFDGQTIGKKIGKIKVVITEEPPDKLSNLPYMTREIFKLIYILPGVTGIVTTMIGLVFYILRNATLQDLISQTAVISIKASEDYE